MLVSNASARPRIFRATRTAGPANLVDEDIDYSQVRRSFYDGVGHQSQQSEQIPLGSRTVNNRFWIVLLYPGPGLHVSSVLSFQMEFRTFSLMEAGQVGEHNGNHHQEICIWHSKICLMYANSDRLRERSLRIPRHVQGDKIVRSGFQNVGEIKF